MGLGNFIWLGGSFNKQGQILLAKRSKYKMLWPEFWEGACASHPRPGETDLVAAKRRLKEELGFSCRLKYLFKFQYQAKYKNVGSENEICAVFRGRYSGPLRPDPREVEDWKFMDLKTFKRDMRAHPSKYCPWLRLAIKRI